MKETFIYKNFKNDALVMINTINNILSDYEAQGYDLSLRQLYYQLVSKNIVENTERSYKNVGVLVSDARLAGLIDWDMIKDRGRVMAKNPHWDDPKDFVESVANHYRFDIWHDQTNYVEVMVEKQALEGVLMPVCKEMDVPFTANKGYTSSSAVYEASRRFINKWNEGRELHVIYLGDHDPSGIDMTRDVLDRLDLFVKTSTGREEEIGPNEVEAVNVHRIALNMDQVRVLNPPENPAKLTDSRAEGYIKRFGRKSWELDAIEPRQLASLVRNAITGLLDIKKFNASVKKMNEDRAKLLKFAKTLEE
jgi:hypothetical protein